jgi:hypothetical protein
MALTLPLVFIITLAGMQLMQYSRLRHAANQAAYEAARRMIIPGGGVDEAVLAANKVADANGLKINSIAVAPETITTETQEVTVTIEAAFTNSWSIVNLAQGNKIDARCTLVHENAAATAN